MTHLKRYCLALDLKDDPALIAEYEKHHQHVWPEIIKSIKDSGIEVLDIYRTGNRLFMIMEVNEDFSFEKKATMMQMIQCTALGKTDVEISTSIAVGKEWRKVGFDGKDF